ncbi:MAG: NAD-dependent epimerase/dehydratase family protein [Cryomorphaceae bacterium]|nr:MAG: NAD-dependent epimerase/dehydratase family protein [Cryomorphaceae bacterium]
MIFVTGGTGILGAQLLCDLAQQGHSIRAMKRSTSDVDWVRKVFHFNQLEDLWNRVEWVDGDLLDIIGLEELTSGCTQVYHAAAVVSFQAGDEQKLLTHNIEGTANMVNACMASGVQKLCYASSIAVFGREPNRGVVNEEAQWKRTPHNSNYAISKYGAEREVWRGTEEGLNAVIVNPSVIVGPCKWDYSSGVLFRSVRNGLPFYTLGTNGFVDVRDVSKAMISLMNSDIRNERFILNGGNVVFQDFFNMVADSLQKKRPHIYARPWMSAIAWRVMKPWGWITGKSPAITKESVGTAHMTSLYSSQKIEKRLGFAFTPIEDAVERTAGFLTMR